MCKLLDRADSLGMQWMFRWLWLLLWFIQMKASHQDGN